MLSHVRPFPYFVEVVNGPGQCTRHSHGQPAMGGPVAVASGRELTESYEGSHRDL